MGSKETENLCASNVLLHKMIYNKFLVRTGHLDVTS